MMASSVRAGPGRPAGPGGRLVDGEIRIGVGKCLRVFAYFELLLGVPATAWLVLSGFKPPVSLTWMVVWGVGQALLGYLIGRSGTQARHREQAAVLNVAIERAIWSERRRGS